MNSITRWNPLREMAAMQTAMDRLFDETWKPLFDDRALALDLEETDQAFLVSTELPGVKAEHVQVRLNGDYLIIDAEIPEQVTEHKDKRMLVKERRSGRFSRQLRLPQPVDESKVEAVYEDGVLRLTLPKSEAVKPRLIPVRANNQS